MAGDRNRKLQTRVRLGLVCTADPGFWDRNMPQSETKIYTRTISIPKLPEGWVVNRVMVAAARTLRPRKDKEG